MMLVVIWIAIDHIECSQILNLNGMFSFKWTIFTLVWFLLEIFHGNEFYLFTNHLTPIFFFEKSFFTPFFVNTYCLTWLQLRFLTLNREIYFQNTKLITKIPLMALELLQKNNLFEFIYAKWRQRERFSRKSRLLLVKLLLSSLFLFCLLLHFL